MVQLLGLIIWGDRSELRGQDGGYFAPGRGTFHGWKVPKDPRVVVLTKSAALRTPRCGHPSLRSLAPPLPTTTTTLGRGWAPRGSAPYDPSSSQSALSSVSAGMAKTALAPLLRLSQMQPLRWVAFGVPGRMISAPTGNYGRLEAAGAACGRLISFPTQGGRWPFGAPNVTQRSGHVGERTSSGVNKPWHLCRGE